MYKQKQSQLLGIDFTPLNEFRQQKIAYYYISGHSLYTAEVP